MKKIKTQRMSCGGKAPGYYAALRKMEAERIKSEQKLEKETKTAKPELPGGKSQTARLKKRRSKGFSTYIYKVLKQVHPDASISSKSMSIMDSFVVDIFDKIATEAGKLLQYNKKCTLSSRDIQTAVRLILPGELAKHAISEGTKATTKFSSS